MKRIFEIKRADFEKILFIHFYPHVVNNRPFFFHKVSLASSMCLFMWIKVDKYDFLKIALSVIKNSINFESLCYVWLYFQWFSYITPYENISTYLQSSLSLANDMYFNFSSTVLRLLSAYSNRSSNSGYFFVEIVRFLIYHILTAYFNIYCLLSTSVVFLFGSLT